MYGKFTKWAWPVTLVFCSFFFLFTPWGHMLMKRISKGTNPVEYVSSEDQKKNTEPKKGNASKVKGKTASATDNGGTSDSEAPAPAPIAFTFTGKKPGEVLTAFIDRAAGVLKGLKDPSLAPRAVDLGIDALKKAREEIGQGLSWNSGKVFAAVNEAAKKLQIWGDTKELAALIKKYLDEVLMGTKDPTKTHD